MNSIDVLLVEDSATDAELTIKALKNQQLAGNIVHMKDGAEALDFIFCKGKYVDRENTLPSLILLDLKVPKIFGVEILEVLKSNELTKDIPVVVLSSSSLDSDREVCRNLGVEMYLVKPIRFEDYATAISQLGVYIKQSE
jgi:two-component system response regulator